MFTAASFLITENCNLRCKYCFENEHRKQTGMTPGVAKKGLEFLFENAAQVKAKEVSIMLFGGEPLLNPVLCDTILTYGLELQEKYKIPFAPSLITNSTVMSDKIELMLFRHVAMNPRFRCQLSIDGDQLSQDMYRVHADGSGSFKDVLEVAPKLIRIFGRRTVVHGCVNKKTLPHLYDNYKFAAEVLKPGGIWYMPIHTEDWDDSDAILYDTMLRLIFEHETTVLKTVSYYAPLDKLLPYKEIPIEQCGRTCGAGTHFCTITTDGNIYPCHNIYFNDPDKTQWVGDVWQGIVKPELLKPYEEFDLKQSSCAKCVNTQCYRCIADNWVVNGDIKKQVGMPYRCRLSDVERKWQLEIRKFAEQNFRNPPSQLDRMEANLAKLTATMATFVLEVCDNGTDRTGDSGNISNGIES